MFRFLKTHSLATGMGLVALMALTGCQNFTSSSKSIDLEGAITVPSEYVYTAPISEKSLTREQKYSDKSFDDFRVRCKVS